MSLCLLSAGVTKSLTLAAFTLLWTHSIEKTAWQEDWRVGAEGLTLIAARIKGSGAGMEPPPEARLVDGWLQWQITRPPQQELVLADSGAAGEWRLCADGHCRTLTSIFGGSHDATTTVLRACAP